jgi:hypothetical protein
MTIDKHIRKVLLHVECSKEEKAELMEELKDHMEAAKEDYITQGYTSKEAEEKAINDFGGDEKVGEELQETISPYRKELLLALGGSGILYSMSIYLHGVVEISEPHPFWLTMMMMMSLFVMVNGFYPSIMANHKIMMNTLLFLYFPFIFIGLLIVDTTDKWYKGPLNILALMMVIMVVATLFITVLRRPNHEMVKVERKKRILFHSVNLIFGLIIISYSCVFGFGMLLFAGLTWMTLLPIGLITFWGISYWIQMKNYHKKSSIAFSFMSLTLLMMVWVVFSYMN